MDFLNRLFANLELFIAAIIGAIVALRFQDDLSTRREKLVFLATGVACAYWVTPLAISLYGIDAGLAGGVAFLLGAFGGSLLAAGFRLIRNLDLVALVKEQLSRFRGTGE